MSALIAKSGQQGKQIDLTYHQTVTPTLSLGGNVVAEVDAFLPLPHVKGITPTVFGIYTRGDDTWMAKFEGGTASGTLRYYREAEKNVEIGAHITTNVQSLESTCGVGMRLGLGHEASGPPGHPSSTLTFNATSDHKVSASLSSTMFSGFTSTQVLTILSASFDHRNQEHTVGAQFQFHY